MSAGTVAPRSVSGGLATLRHLAGSQGMVLALSIKLIIDRLLAGDSGQSSVGIIVLL